MLAYIRRGEGNIARHVERLRTENPRLYASLQPLLEDLGEWMGHVSTHVETESRRLTLDLLGRS